MILWISQTYIFIGFIHVSHDFFVGPGPSQTFPNILERLDQGNT